MFMMHGDDKGLIIPPPIAPVQIMIVPIFKENNKKIILKKADELKKKIEKHFRVEIDKREECTPGWKFNEWELKGVPLRLELGPKDIENNQAVLVRRDDGKKSAVKVSDVIKEAEKILKNIHDKLYKQSEKNFKDSIVEVSTMKQLKKTIKDKKMALAPFCNKPGCEDWIKEETEGATTRNIPPDKKVEKGVKCIQCKKEAKVMVYIAKAY